MAKSFGMLADAVTGLTGVGVLRSFKRSTEAEVKYARTAAGVPDGSNAVAGPKKFSASLEISGTVPTAGTTDITISAQAYHVTKAEESYSGEGEVATVDVEGSQKF